MPTMISKEKLLRKLFKRVEILKDGLCKSPEDVNPTKVTKHSGDPLMNTIYQRSEIGPLMSPQLCLHTKGLDQLVQGLYLTTLFGF